MGLVRSHPLLVYCLITFGISWGGIALLIGPGGVALDEDHLAILLGFGYVGMLLGPTVAAIFVIARTEGRSGLRDLWLSTCRWQVGGRWYALAFLSAPLAMLVVLLAMSAVSADFLPRLFVEPDPAALLAYVAVSATITGVFEEVGWTGFVARSLLRRQSVVRAALVIGLLGGMWNFLIVYVKELSVPTPGPMPNWLFLPLGLFTWQVAYRVLMVWSYARTQSLALVMVMQTILVATWTSLTPVTMDRVTLVLFYLSVTVIWAALAMIGRAERGLRVHDMALAR